MVLERQDLMQGLTKKLQDVIQGFTAINLPRVGQDTVAMQVLFQEGDRRYTLGLDEISDGQRSLIALYALVHLAAGQGYSLFLDEPDNYLALREIQPWLFDLEDACGETLPQAVLCSHHPELIDYLGCRRGVLLECESSGVTRSKTLDETTGNGLKLSEIVARGWEK
jgi:predicted ATPase